MLEQRTEIELNEKKERVIDAVGATKAKELKKE